MNKRSETGDETPREKFILQKIKESTQRNVTFCKRKRGLLKKVIELSVLCDIDIQMVMFDKEK